MSLSYTPEQARFWIAVASAEHVRKGRAQGFMQVCHGKRGPLSRLAPRDGIAYYSSVERFGAKAKCGCFTALGFVREGSPYRVDINDRVDLGGGFRPFRRDVDWAPTRETPIAPLLETLAFSAGKRNWGYALRFGLFEIQRGDFEILRERMVVSFPHESPKDEVLRESLL